MTFTPGCLLRPGRRQKAPPPRWDRRSEPLNQHGPILYRPLDPQLSFAFAVPLRRSLTPSLSPPRAKRLQVVVVVVEVAVVVVVTQGLRSHEPVPMAVPPSAAQSSAVNCSQSGPPLSSSP